MLTLVSQPQEEISLGDQAAALTTQHAQLQEQRDEERRRRTARSNKITTFFDGIAHARAAQNKDEIHRIVDQGIEYLASEIIGLSDRDQFFVAKAMTTLLTAALYQPRIERLLAVLTESFGGTTRNILGDDLYGRVEKLVVR